MLAPALAATQAGTPLITIVDGQDISIVGAEFLAPPAAENGKAQIETTNVKNLVLYGGYNERLPGARPVDYLSVNGQSEGILLEGLRAYRPVVQQGASVDHFTVLSTFLADTTIVRGQVTNSWLDLGGMGLKTTESASITGSIISGIALQQEVPAIASGNHIVRAHTPVLDDVESALSLTQKTDKTLGRPQRVLGNLQRTSKIFNQSASIAPTVDWALAKPTNAAIELTLPSAASVSGQSKTIKKMAGSTQNLVVKAATGETIDALADATISSPSGSLELTSDGENWWITNGS